MCIVYTTLITYTTDELRDKPRKATESVKCCSHYIPMNIRMHKRYIFIDAKTMQRSIHKQTCSNTLFNNICKILKCN